MTKKALIIFSGGQDSTTCLAMIQAAQAFHEIHLLSFDYGQRHRRELDAAYQIGKLAGVASHEVIEVGPILAGTSPLTDRNQELEQYENHDQMEAIIGARVEKTFVPMRNSLFLTIAANRAAVMEATCIVTGVCEADNANYPDCRGVFLLRQEQAINEALGNALNDPKYIYIQAPLLDKSKQRSVIEFMKLGREKFAWLAFSHTAYDGQYPPLGKDHATVLRAHGFEQANLPDPLFLRAKMEGLIDVLPATPNYQDERLNAQLVFYISQHKKALGINSAGDAWEVAK